MKTGHLDLDTLSLMPAAGLHTTIFLGEGTTLSHQQDLLQFRLQLHINYVRSYLSL